MAEIILTNPNFPDNKVVILKGGDGKTPAGSGGEVIITTKADYSGGYLSAGEQPLKAEVEL